MVEILLCPTEKRCSEEAHKLMKNIQWGKSIIIMTPEQFQRVFSPEKMRILLLLKGNHESISALAKQLERPFESVHRDIKVLESYGLVVLRKADRRVIPRLIGKITVPIVA